MKYIPLVALLLCQTIAIGAEELPEFKTQVTPYNAPRIILAQLPEAGGEAAEEAATEVCEDNTSEAECAAAPACIWEEDECVDDDDLDDDDVGDDDVGDDDVGDEVEDDGP